MYVNFSTLAQLILSTKLSKSNDFAYFSIQKLAYPIATLTLTYFPLTLMRLYLLVIIFGNKAVYEVPGFIVLL